MNSNDKLKSVLKVLVIIFIFILIAYGYYLEQNKTRIIPNVELTDKEKIEDLKKENENYQDEIGHLESQLEELQQDYEEAKDLIYILREQLEDHGIEPYDL